MKMDYVWIFLLVVGTLLLIVMSSLSILGTYSLLNHENHEWQWSAFSSPFFISLYIFVYSIYHYFSKTTMSGIVQTAYFFGYMSMLSFIIGVICGFIGFIASALFVKNIYKNLKTD